MQSRLIRRVTSLSVAPQRCSHILSISALHPARDNLTADDAGIRLLESHSNVGPSIAGVIAAAVIVSTALPSVALAEEIYSAGPSQYRYPAAERYSEQQQSRFDEYLQTTELRALLDMLQGNPSSSDLDRARLKVSHSRWRVCTFQHGYRMHSHHGGGMAGHDCWYDLITITTSCCHGASV